MRKMKLLHIIALSCSALIISGCFTAYHATDYFSVSGERITESRQVAECSGLVLEGVGEVYLTQGKTQSIRIEADKDIMGKIKTERIHGKLVLSLRGNNHFLSKIKYYITLNEIKDLEINGSGSIELTEPVRTENLYGVINGNGNIDLQGICRTFRCEINGAGTISAFDLKSKKCRAEINGTGTCEVFATDNLDAEISGVGKIVYIGEPDVESEVNGIGAVYSR